MSQIQGPAAQAIMLLTVARLQSLMLLPELEHVPSEKWEDYISNRDPKLPFAANVGMLEYGRLPTEAFVTKVPAAWSDRVRDLSTKLNAAAMVIVLQEPVPDPVLAPLEADISRALAEENILADLWLMITIFFSEGTEAASYFFVALEAAVMSGSRTVERLNIPAPAKFWKEPDWHEPRAVMALILVLAADHAQIPSAMAVLSRSLGTPDPSLERMEREASAPIRAVFEYAKAEAYIKGATNVFGVDLVDKGLKRFEEEERGEMKDHLSFRRMFVMGVCPGGVKIWQAGGVGFEEGLNEQNERLGPGPLVHEDAEQFMQAFIRLVANKGQWNSKRRKWYKRCFGVDLKELEEEKQKKLLTEYEPWVQLHLINDMERENIAKFTWQ